MLSTVRVLRGPTSLPKSLVEYPYYPVATYGTVPFEVSSAPCRSGLCSHAWGNHMFKILRGSWKSWVREAQMTRCVTCRYHMDIQMSCDPPPPPPVSCQLKSTNRVPILVSFLGVRRTREGGGGGRD